MHRRHASAPLWRCAWAWSVPASPRGRRRSRPSYRRWWLSCPGADVRHALLSSTSSQARSFDCQLRAANYDRHLKAERNFGRWSRVASLRPLPQFCRRCARPYGNDACYQCLE